MVTWIRRRMSKLSFRARALDASKPMPVYLSDDFPDLPEVAINRSVPQMPTGMEKDEECERHLQQAINARQTLSDSTASVVIPTPEVFENLKHYEAMYPANYYLPKQYIHVQPLHMEQEYPEYDADSEDEQWLSTQSHLCLSLIQFEEMIEKLEKGSGQQILTLQEALMLLHQELVTVEAIYKYWQEKRLRLGHPLILSVRMDKMGTSGHNPYVAFRRRVEKMQTRKNRKNDEVSYEKMLKLRRDLSRAVTLLEMVRNRETTKRDLLRLTVKIFELRYQLADFSGDLLAEITEKRTNRTVFTPLHINCNEFKDELPRRQKRPYKRRNFSKTVANLSLDQKKTETQTSRDASVEDDRILNLSGFEQDGPFGFQRKLGCQYQPPLPFGRLSWPWYSSAEGGTANSKYQYSLTSLSNPHHFLGLSRRRLGRGGRIILDRTSLCHDELLEENSNKSDDELCDENLGELSNKRPHFYSRTVDVSQCNDEKEIRLSPPLQSAPLFITINAEDSNLTTIVSLPDASKHPKLNRPPESTRLPMPSDHEYASTWGGGEVEEENKDGNCVTSDFSTGAIVRVIEHCPSWNLDSDPSPCWLDWDALDEDDPSPPPFRTHSDITLHPTPTNLGCSNNLTNSVDPWSQCLDPGFYSCDMKVTCGVGANLSNAINNAECMNTCSRRSSVYLQSLTPSIVSTLNPYSDDDNRNSGTNGTSKVSHRPPAEDAPHGRGSPEENNSLCSDSIAVHEQSLAMEVT